MITLFNRKELTSTFDLSEQMRVRDLLASHGMDYRIKTINRMSPSPMAAGTRSRAGTFGQQQSAMYEYIFYVQKKDYDLAHSLLK